MLLLRVMLHLGCDSRDYGSDEQTCILVTSCHHMVWIAHTAGLIHTSNYMERSHAFRVNMCLGIVEEEIVSKLGSPLCCFTANMGDEAKKDTLISSMVFLPHTN